MTPSELQTNLKQLTFTVMLTYRDQQVSEFRVQTPVVLWIISSSCILAFDLSVDGTKRDETLPVGFSEMSHYIMKLYCRNSFQISVTSCISQSLFPLLVCNALLSLEILVMVKKRVHNLIYFNFFPKVNMIFSYSHHYFTIFCWL